MSAPVVISGVAERFKTNWFFLESSSRFLEEEIYRRDGKKSFSSLSVENNDLKSLCWTVLFKASTLSKYTACDITEVVFTGILLGRRDSFFDRNKKELIS